MALFFGIIAASVITYIGAFCLALPIIWFYSFFDTVNRMGMSVEELRMLPDHYLFSDRTAAGKMCIRDRL